MGVFLLFLIAEIAVVVHQVKARQEILEKWKNGELSMEELLYLKTRPWFHKLFPTPYPLTSHSKKNS
jgi:hypothetical protein